MLYPEYKAILDTKAMTTPRVLFLLLAVFFLASCVGTTDTGGDTPTPPPIETVEPPSFSLADGTYTTTQQVEISSATHNADIYYTTDGSIPTTNSQRYFNQLSISESTLLRAIAIKEGMNDSTITSANYQIEIINNDPYGATQNENSILVWFTPEEEMREVIVHTSLNGTNASYPMSFENNRWEYNLASCDADSGTLTYRFTSINTNGVGNDSEEYSFQVPTQECSSNSDDYVQGASKLGSAVTLWIIPSYAQAEEVIVHYSITDTTGHSTAKTSPKMYWSNTNSRWEMSIAPVSTGDTITYSFTYPSNTGANQGKNLDTEEFVYTLEAIVKTVDISPPGGVYTDSQQIRLSTNVNNAVIHYTLDGSAPNTQSPIYSSPLTIDRSLTVNAITATNGSNLSDISSESYAIGLQTGTVAAPTFSFPSNTTHDNIIRVDLNTETNGAYIRFTTDGTTPTKNSRVYTTPVEIKIEEDETAPVTRTVKAIATKDGWTQSEVVTATYTVTSNDRTDWDGMTTYRIVNQTKGEYADNEVYWAIIGRDWDTDKFVHVSADGDLVPMSTGDNTVAKNGQLYADYFHRLSELSSVTIRPINSARLMVSVGEPMYIWVNEDVNGNVAYAGANVENPNDPNIDVIFDFGEFATVPPGKPYSGIFINTSRVDHFGFPLQLSVTGADGFTQTVGETLEESRDELFARFIAETPPEFNGLAQAPYAPYRIMAPAHASFQTGHDGKAGEHADYLDPYIDQVWDKWRNEDLILKLDNGWPTFTARVIGQSLVFDDGLDTYTIHGKPSTSMVMLGNGLLDDATGTTPGSDKYNKQLQLQAQVAAAINRHTAHLQGEYWHNVDYFFPEGSRSNWYTKFWHDYAINGLTYGFSYDDVGGYSPSIYTHAPKTVTYTIGW